MADRLSRSVALASRVSGAYLEARYMDHWQIRISKLGMPIQPDRAAFPRGGQSIDCVLAVACRMSDIDDVATGIA